MYPQSSQISKKTQPRKVFTRNKWICCTWIIQHNQGDLTYETRILDEIIELCNINTTKSKHSPRGPRSSTLVIQTSTVLLLPRMWATGTEVALTLVVKASHLSIYALTSYMPKSTTLPTPEWCRNNSMSTTTTTTSVSRLRHPVNWLRTPTSWVKSSSSPLSPKTVSIFPKRGRIRLGTTMSHRVLLFLMTSIGIPIKCDQC